MNRRIDLINQKKCCLETESIAKVKKEISTFAGGSCGCGCGCGGEVGCCCAVFFWKSLENMVDWRGAVLSSFRIQIIKHRRIWRRWSGGFHRNFFLRWTVIQSWWLVGLFTCLLSELLPGSKLHGAFSCV